MPRTAYDDMLAAGPAADRLRALTRDVAALGRPYGDAGRFHDGHFAAPLPHLAGR